MQITHFGHACVVIDNGDSRLLVDPGTLSSPEVAYADIDGILLTHSHVDHVDVETVQRLRQSNTAAGIIADAASARTLAEAGIDDVASIDSPVTAREELAGVSIEATTVAHATIHCDLPGLANNCYLIAESVLHPGDALWVPSRPVDVLLLPIGGPWMKLSESIDYLRAVAPRVAIPIHQGGLAEAHRKLHCDLLRKLGPSNTEIRTLIEGEATSV